MGSAAGSGAPPPLARAGAGGGAQGQALGLPQTAGIGRDHPIAAGIATLAQVAKEPHRGIAARIPAFEERRVYKG